MVILIERIGEALGIFSLCVDSGNRINNVIVDAPVNAPVNAPENAHLTITSHSGLVPGLSRDEFFSGRSISANISWRFVLLMRRAI